MANQQHAKITRLHPTRTNLHSARKRVSSTRARALPTTARALRNLRLTSKRLGTRVGRIINTRQFVIIGSVVLATAVVGAAAGSAYLFWWRK